MTRTKKYSNFGHASVSLFMVFIFLCISIFGLSASYSRLTEGIADQFSMLPTHGEHIFYIIAYNELADTGISYQSAGSVVRMVYRVIRDYVIPFSYSRMFELLLCFFILLLMFHKVMNNAIIIWREISDGKK